MKVHTVLRHAGLFSTSLVIAGSTAFAVDKPTPTPQLPPAMSKHTLEAFNDPLAQELVPFGVRVLAVEPGNFNTNVGKTAKARMIEKGQTFDGLPYGEQLEGTLNRLVEPDGKEGPDRVVLTMAQALGADDPFPRYRVVSNEREAQITLSLGLRKIAELNASQGYRYNAGELLAMLQKQIDGAWTP